MSTMHHRGSAPSGMTGLEQLPPLTVVTVGIPASEHVEVVEPAPPLLPLVAARTSTADAPAGLWYRLGVVALLVLVLGSFGYGVQSLLQPPASSARMGLSATEWTTYRAGERAVGATSAVVAAPGATASFAPWDADDPFSASLP